MKKINVKLPLNKNDILTGKVNNDLLKLRKLTHGVLMACPEIKTLLRGESIDVTLACHKANRPIDAKITRTFSRTVVLVGETFKYVIDPKIMDVTTDKVELKRDKLTADIPNTMVVDSLSVNDILDTATIDRLNKKNDSLLALNTALIENNKNNQSLINEQQAQIKNNQSLIKEREEQIKKLTAELDTMAKAIANHGSELDAMEAKVFKPVVHKGITFKNVSINNGKLKVDVVDPNGLESSLVYALDVITADVAKLNKLNKKSNTKKTTIKESK